jgi:hypothetical protein
MGSTNDLSQENRHTLFEECSADRLQVFVVDRAVFGLEIATTIFEYLQSA